MKTRIGFVLHKVSHVKKLPKAGPAIIAPNEMGYMLRGWQVFPVFASDPMPPFFAIYKSELGTALHSQILCTS